MKVINVPQTFEPVFERSNFDIIFYDQRIGNHLSFRKDCTKRVRKGRKVTLSVKNEIQRHQYHQNVLKYDSVLNIYMNLVNQKD